MYIKSIVLDGFKSYGNRVEVTGFDPEFNAITGLNGTGKSNILDSICFVLGITNLSNVRAGSLQELIYKHGQAGITKATVSITFDNRDKKQCPIGYENHEEITVTRQVVMGGKNKYLINGINVQNKRVADLFCSVQLNVNNPHFLIMQGRITKVLNMKPPEILAMVEEAAGTRMFEAKKQAAQRTIEKKDAKLRELNDIIKEDIAPKLQKLQDERAQFQEYQKVVRELENLTRLHAAWRYVSAERSAQEAADKVAAALADVQAQQAAAAAARAQAAALAAQAAELSRQLDQESGSVLRRLEAQLAAREQAEAEAGAAQRAAADALAAHEKRSRLMLRARTDDEAALRDKRRELEKVSATFARLQAAAAQAERARAAAQAGFLAVSEGRDHAGGNLQDLLMAAKQEAAEAGTRVAQADMERRHVEARLRALRADAQAGGAQFRREQAGVRALEAAVQRLQAQLAELAHEPAAGAALRERGRALQAACRRRREQCEALAARLQRCQLRYSDPEPGFDRARVHGTVCRLIAVRDPKYCTALETAAGGRLYNVVVDTEHTSRLLLQRGQLQSRTTIIPLNKISAQVIDAQTVKLAQSVGGGADKVQLALELVTFGAAVAPAVRWVLGGTLVCADLDTARRVTFHAGVRRRCVTLDGDVCDPAGTLSGGARASGAPVLQQLAELRALEEEARAGDAELAALQAELAAAARRADAFQQLQQRHEEMSHELEVMRARVAATEHAQAHAEIEALAARLRELEAALDQDKEAQRDAAARAQDLEAKVKDIKGHREREFKKAEQALQAATKSASERGAAWRRREQESETLRLELRELEAAVAAHAALVHDAALQAVALHADARDAAAALQDKQAAVKATQAEVKQQKAEISSRSAEVARLLQRRERLAADEQEAELAVKQLHYSVAELQAEAKDCQKRIAALEAEHAWIAGERQYFGLAGGLYDFAARRAEHAGARREQLRERRDRLQRGLNARAHTLLGKEEEQYQDVVRKRRIVEADRAKLVQVMAELDDKKRRTLRAAAEQVGRDFGSIFAALLPGAQAALRPPPGGSVLDGLEVRVGFNGAWKESLGELSGGQRSLVALALVLAMLLFKPAPLYILDEVDAALDLSHTQNIGHMLKEHFKHSQFIVVSLKDGMFNNANVLFRTKFVDGMSCVQRTATSRR